MIIDLGLVACQTEYGHERLSQVNSLGSFALEQFCGSQTGKKWTTASAMGSVGNVTSKSFWDCGWQWYWHCNALVSLQVASTTQPRGYWRQDHKNGRRRSRQLAQFSRQFGFGSNSISKESVKLRGKGARMMAAIPDVDGWRLTGM
jgi:hypothetical protein